MRALIRTFLAVLALVGIGACDNPLAAGDSVEVRVRNSTSMTLTDISLSWPGGGMQLSQLAPGAVSNYEAHDGAYPYGALRVTGNGTVRRLQPIDYVGASPLSPGKYTYVIVSSTFFADGIDLQLEVAN
jgi:hypothetical protein